MEILQAIILGAIQGFAEWLPVSSEGLSTLALVNFFNKSATEALTLALWLHIGTMCSALVYYWKDFKKMFIEVTTKRTPTTNFVIIATITSLAIGGTLYIIGTEMLTIAALPLTIAIGVFLLITGSLIYFSRKNIQTKKEPSIKDALLTGFFQGFAVIPGISRSGTTTSLLLFRKFSAEESLHLSFLMSVPLVAALAFFLAITEPVLFSLESLIALIISFIVGLVTIKGFVALAKKINFAYFCWGFGLVMILVGVLL